MKNNLLVSLIFVIMLLLMVSPVIAQLSELGKYDFKACLSGKGLLPSEEFVKAFDACSAPHLEKISEYPELSKKFKEIIELKKALETHKRDLREKEEACEDVCNDKYWECVKSGEYKTIDLCAEQFLYAKEKGPCSRECRTKFATSRFSDPSDTPNIKEAIRLDDAYSLAKQEYAALLKREESPGLDKGDYDIKIGSTGKVQGTVEVQQADGSWKQIIEGEALKAGDLIRTRSDGSTKLNFGDSDVTLGPNTAFRVEELDSTKKTFTLSAGRIWAYVQKVTGQIFTVKTPGAAVAIRGTEFILEYDEETETATLHLNEGEVEITTEAGADIITAGKTITFDKTGITSEQELTEEDWQSSLGELEIKDSKSKLTYGLRNTMLILGVLFLINIAILGGITVIIKKKSGKETKAWGKGSLILGILSIILFPFSLGFASGLGAIYFYRLQKKIKPNGFAKAGLVLGIIGIVLTTLMLLFLLSLG